MYDKTFETYEHKIIITCDSLNDLKGEYLQNLNFL